MNTSKTEFIIFGSRKQQYRCRTKHKSINGDEIKLEYCTCIQYLGAYLDETPNFKDHIKRKCRTAMINYLIIKSIVRKYFDTRCNRKGFIFNYFLFELLPCDFTRIWHSTEWNRYTVKCNEFKTLEQNLYWIGRN
jgi:hypothetical protein